MTTPEKDLHDAFGTKGADTAPSQFRHPDEAKIIKSAYDLLSEIPAGKELIPIAKERDCRIKVVIGREPDVFTHGDDRITIVCPKLYGGVNPYEMACNLGIGLREVELNYNGNQLVTGDVSSFYRRTVDIVILMCRMVSEFHDVKGHTKLIDKMTRLGHHEVYGLYKSHASYDVMKEKIISVISAT